MLRELELKPGSAPIAARENGFVVATTEVSRRLGFRSCGFHISFGYFLMWRTYWAMICSHFVSMAPINLVPQPGCRAVSKCATHAVHSRCRPYRATTSGVRPSCSIIHSDMSC